MPDYWNWVIWIQSERFTLIIASYAFVTPPKAVIWVQCFRALLPPYIRSWRPSCFLTLYIFSEIFPVAHFRGLSRAILQSDRPTPRLAVQLTTSPRCVVCLVIIGEVWLSNRIYCRLEHYHTHTQTSVCRLQFLLASPARSLIAILHRIRLVTPRTWSGFRSCRHLRPTGLQCRYSNPPPPSPTSHTRMNWTWLFKPKSRSVRRSASQSFCLAPSGEQDLIFVTVRQPRFCRYGEPSLARGRVCPWWLSTQVAHVIYIHNFHVGNWHSNFSRFRFLAETRYLQFHKYHK
jgi:hypothetical protein